jgi:hypothetical protein
MAEAIQNRRASAETIQQLQKDKAEKKRALGEQARQEMKEKQPLVTSKRKPKKIKKITSYNVKSAEIIQSITAKG